VKTSEIVLTRHLSQWEVKRVDRLKLETLFERFTGLIHVVELHIPYTKYDLFKKLLHKASLYEGKKILVLAGDSLNLDLFSRFKQRSTDNSKPSDEIDKLIKLLKESSKVYDNIVYMTTNHEDRLTKVVLDAIADKDVANEVLKQTRTLKDIFETENLKVVYVANYFFQIGDLIICHMEANRVVTGALSRDLVSYFKPRINKSFNAIIQAHTHRQSMVYVDRVLVIECGCMLPSLDYWLDGKLKGNRCFSTIGYAQAEMRGGVTSINDTRPVMMEWCGYI
jgi:hypothetical protein